MKRFSITRFPLKNKIIFLRADLDVPLNKSKVKDNKRLKSALPTIKFLLKNNCKIIIAGHLGRPQGKLNLKLSSKPVFKEFKKLLPEEKITFLKDSIGKELKKTIKAADPKEIFILENLRFYKEEVENDAAFAHSLANLADVYVNDSFANSHRKHASIHKITKYLPSMAGINIENEIKQLAKALRPELPLVWVLGGAKLEKVALFRKLLENANYILVGGALAFSFLRAKGFPVGTSKVNKESIKLAKKLLRHKKSKKIILPVDFLVSEKISPQAKAVTVPFNNIKHQQIGLDLGKETIELFKKYLRGAKTVVWNGPLGYFEWQKYSKSTKEIGRFISKLTAITICGGGDTERALKKFHLEHLMTHVSTGGGSALTFLEGKKLIGITALENNYKKFRKKISN